MRTSFEAARLQLSRLHIDESRREADVLSQAAKISAQTLEVERVGVWFLVPDGRLECRLLYTRTGDCFEVGTPILRTDAAPYFAALEQRRVIATTDALVDPVTSCLESYLRPRMIGAMLDAPFYIDGELFGVVCHEHVGGPRTWKPFELDFAATFADILTSLYLQRRLREQEQRVRQTASQLQDAARLASLTHVTRAFAHDVNNALTVALLVGSRLVGTESAELAQLGEELVSTSQFAARVLKELQTFASRQGDDVVSIGTTIETFRPVLEALVRELVTLDIRIVDPSAVPVASRTKIEQILINLCLNARDASPLGGAVTVTAARSHDGTELVLSVTDQGTGIDPALLPTIFDAYVTTKPTGSGLGLAIVRGIATEHGGTVDVASALGAGTTFTVRIPLVQAGA